MSFSKVLVYLSYFSVGIPLMLMLSRAKILRDATMASLGLLLLTSATSDLLSYLLIKAGEPSIIVTNIYFVVQFLLLSYLFAQLITRKKYIYFSLIIFCGFALYANVRIQTINEYQSWTRGFGSFLLIGYCVLYYNQLMRTIPTDNLLPFVPFWITLAVFIYFGFNLTLFIMANYIFENMPEAAVIFWISHNVSNIIKNFLFTIAIYYRGSTSYIN